MYTLINGSPKPNCSNSMYFLKIISSYLNKYKLFEIKHDDYEEILNNIYKSDVIVIAFPLYVDSPPSIILEFLDYIVDKGIELKDKYIYLVINCGFREGKHNITAVNIIKRWCKKVKAIYCSSILIGSGEIVGKEKYKFISKKALKEINRFASVVEYKMLDDDKITTMDLINNQIYCFIANLFWNRKAKINGLTCTDLRVK